MIDKMPETKEEYVEYHKLLWQGIIDYINEYGVYGDWGGNHNYIKMFVFNCLFCFTGDGYGYCFGCLYKQSKKRGCLFEIKNWCNGTNPTCLDGIWYKFLETTNKEDAIKYAEQIRDFPVKED